AGGAYVPLDPAHPPARLAFMLRDSGAAVLLTRSVLLASLQPLPGGVCPVLLETHWEGEPGVPRDAAPLPGPENLAYVIYTSGSTGLPKGVMVTHGNVASYARWSAAAYEVTGHAGSCVHTSPSFDLTVTSLLTPLLAGTAVHLLPEETALSGLVRAVAAGGNGFMKLTPAHLELLRDQADALAAVDPLTLVVGGEALQGAALGGWPAEARIFNEYGPTETTVGCCAWRVPAGWQGPVPIGRPIAGAR